MHQGYTLGGGEYMKKIVSWLDDNLEETILVALLLAMSCVMMMQVIVRYVFSSAMAWPEEFCRYCFVYSGMLSAGYCIRKKVGIRVDLVVNFMPKLIRIFLEYFSKLTLLTLYGYLFYSSFGLISITTTVSSAMQLPIKFVYMAFPIGFGLGTIRGIQDLVLYTKSLTAAKGDKETC